MSYDSNKEMVRGYFSDVVDKRDVSKIDEFFTKDCVIHRPEVPEPIKGRKNFKQALSKVIDNYSELKTTIYDLIAEGDRVACRLSHSAINKGEWTSRIGRHAVAGKPVSWSAMAIFRFQDGKIAEEWVNRDELGMMIMLGVLPAHTP